VIQQKVFTHNMKTFICNIKKVNSLNSLISLSSQCNDFESINQKFIRLQKQFQPKKPIKFIKPFRVRTEPPEATRQSQANKYPSVDSESPFRPATRPKTLP
jgi:hypothetical protein